MDMSSKDEVRFLVADVGGNTWEEINEGALGANYGWPIQEGPCRMLSDVDCKVSSGMFVDLFYWYAHTEEGGCTVGGTFIPDKAG